MLIYFELAKSLNDEFRTTLLENDLHFRGNFNSISLISLNKETPELGISGIKTREKAESELKNITNGTRKLSDPQRPTPEKILQAYLIRIALKNSDKLLPIGIPVKFITSEIVVRLDQNKHVSNESQGEKLVNDILGISDKASLYIVELKSFRKFKELKGQLDKFEKVIETNKDIFSKIISIHKDNWNGSIKKLAIWPKTEGKEKEVDWGDIEVIEYQNVGADDYRFSLLR